MAERRKGIVLAGGNGSRLFPITKAVNKHLLPVHDKPLIYYPLSVLMLAGVRDLMLITSPDQIANFKRLLGTGEHLGISIQYAGQDEPRGIADGLLIARDFIGTDGVVLILGDNIFFGQGFQDTLVQAAAHESGATIFSYEVKDPGRYGVVELDSYGSAVSIEEKPSQPTSRSAVTGLYFYDNQAVDIAAEAKPSPRGELEITDVNREYLCRGQLRVIPLGRGFAWLDAGTFSSLLQAANFVQTIEERQGLRIACLEEIAFVKGFIPREQLQRLADQMQNPYGQYLQGVASRAV